MPRPLIPAAALALLAAAASPVSSQCEHAHDDKIIASNGVALEQYGRAVGIDGNLALVGAPEQAGQGAVYAYQASGGAWAEVQQLTASDVGAGDHFGFAMALEGATAVVGAYGHNSSTGAVYVFTWNGSQWSEVQKLTASDAASGDAFGWAVDVSGSLLLVGATNDNDKGTASGSVYVFQHNGTQFVEQQKLTASDGLAIDLFGTCVATDGTYVAVGAPGKDDLGSSTGAAYLFHWSGSTWTEQQKLTPSDLASGDWLGTAVDVDNGQVVVTSLRNDKPARDCGSAYVFQWDGQKWGQDQKIRPAGAFSAMDFGQSVCLDGDRMLVGSPRDSNAGGTNPGSVRTYHHNGTSWVEVGKRVEGDINSGSPDQHGYAVGLSGDTVLAGALFGQGNVADSGAAYLHDWYDLAEDAQPDSVTSGATLTLLTCGGQPGTPRALFVTALNGSPFVQMLDLSAFGNQGRVGFGGPVPPGLSGLTADFLAIGAWAPGSLVASNGVVVTFL